jgi:hypothetical protein
MKHPSLLIDKSNLGAAVGKGLFAAKDINLKSGGRPVQLCYFFGKLVLLNEVDLYETNWDNDIFYGCRKNIIEFDRVFNPIIYPTGPDAPPKDSKLKLFLIASNCCLASYANTAAEDECNARIRTVLPGSWDSTTGFESLAHFMGIVRKPVLCLELIK